MNKTSPRPRVNRLVLNLETARQLMTPEPICIPATALVKEAVAVLVDRGISAAAVVDALGRPVGVLSQTDIAIHYRNKNDAPAPAPEYYQKVDLATGHPSVLSTLRIDQRDQTLVHQVMTPTVIAVAPNDSVVRVVGEMVAFKIHRLFVVAEDGVLVGVISAFDVLRKLRAESDVYADDPPTCAPYEETLFDCRP